MPVKRYPHSIRFSPEEWKSINRAAAQYEFTPGEFVREAAVRVAAKENGLSDVRLPPELMELLKRTFRAAHVLAYLKREELARDGSEQAFRRAAKAAKTAQSETFSGRE